MLTCFVIATTLFKLTIQEGTKQYILRKRIRSIKRLQAYHIAEINADTFAEYIAIGCSASILYFFGEHPFYSLLRQSESSGQRNQQFAQLKMLLFQLVVEVLVDFVSTLLEMSVGIEFELVNNLGAFFTVLFMVTAVLNINISAGIYLF
eukprot:jgi/Phyca11/102092/e_gw1.6.377.1